MNRLEAIKKAQEAHDKELADLDKIPDWIDFSHVSGSKIFLHNSTYEEGCEQIHHARSQLGNYELIHYFMSETPYVLIISLRISL